MRRNIKESTDVATGVADGHKRGVRVNPETHITSDVSNDGVWGMWRQNQGVFSLRQGFLRSPLLGRRPFL